MKNLDALIFIDTNIYLDFYRIRRSDISMSYLELIDKNKKHIITGSQIEMEFKKNRQKVILESLKKFKTPDWHNLSAPALLAESQAMLQIEKKKKEIGTQQRKVNAKIEKMLNNPSRNDPVFTTLNRLFRYKSKTNLDRGKKIRFNVRNLARKRFVLGYPPRKKDDISIGDAVNWEWVIRNRGRSCRTCIANAISARTSPINDKFESVCVISAIGAEKAHEIRKVRNEIVHQGLNIASSEALRLVRNTKDILEEIFN